jgi:hypothetical protein
MQFLLSFVILAAQVGVERGVSVVAVVSIVALLVLIIIGLVFVSVSFRKVLASLEEIKAKKQAPNLNQQVQQPKPSSAIADLSVVTRLEGMLQSRFDNLLNEIGTDLAELKASIEKLNVSRSTAPAEPAVVAADPARGPVIELAARVAVEGRSRLDSDQSLVRNLIRTYNASNDEFKAQFNPKAAQLVQGKQTPVQLAPHDAGSFCIVELLGRCYCVPRPRKITPILHENVGLGLLFRCDGYDPKGPDMNFCLEKPASLTADSDSGWSLREPGQIRVKSEEA